MKGLEQNRDFFSSLGPDADAYDVYESYMEQVGSAYRFLSENSMDIKEELHDEIFSMLENITDEAIPLIETLPSEMGDDEKAAVAKIYYTERLKGVSSFKNYVSEYVNNR